MKNSTFNTFDTKRKPPSDFVFRVPLGKVNFGTTEIACQNEINKSNIWGNIEERTFIETGTFYGHGIMSAILKGCRDIHTVEINPDIWEGACNRIFSLIMFNKENVSFEMRSDKDFFSVIFGDSIRISMYNGCTMDKLPLMLSRINEKSCLWLDAHWSGTETELEGVLEENTDDRVKVPLLQELAAIKNHHIKDHTIMIDDYNCVCASVDGGFEEIKNNIKSINKNYKITKVKKEDQEDYIIMAKV
tara:strand:+ start:67 stop:804 length:738 start_codon:yes stop_codon:yes gene_type:complete